mmetsp:Transcript_13160/g.26298  ORF Transcript_13160/g.26298 Transcript_13160/m.26298 type:complete len:245 (-) Transcript_13160:80-814(-)
MPVPRARSHWKRNSLVRDQPASTTTPEMIIRLPLPISDRFMKSMKPSMERRIPTATSPSPTFLWVVKTLSFAASDLTASVPLPPKKAAPAAMAASLPPRIRNACVGARSVECGGKICFLGSSCRFLRTSPVIPGICAAPRPASRSGNEEGSATQLGSVSRKTSKKAATIARGLAGMVSKRLIFPYDLRVYARFPGCKHRKLSAFCVVSRGRNREYWISCFVKSRKDEVDFVRGDDLDLCSESSS